MSFDGARTADAADPLPRSAGTAGDSPLSVTDESVTEESVTAEGDVRRTPRDGADAHAPRGGRRPAFSLGRLLVLLAIAAVLVAGVRAFFVQAFVIPTESMRPMLQVGDRVLVDRLGYRIGDVHRGDVIVFDGEGVFDPPADGTRSPLVAAGRAFAGALGMPIGESDYVKRVVGLPGERIACCDAAGRITVDGRPLEEPYLTGTRASEIPFDIRVPSGRYWVMGDNRNDSGDSRAHLGDPGGGTVPKDHVIGRVVSVWWPWNRATGIGRVDTSARGAQEGAP